MIKRAIGLALLTAGFGCGGEAPTALPDMPPSYGVTGGSGCYAVSGALDQVGTGPNEFGGTISGDVEGSVVTVGGPVLPHGVVLSRPGQQSWRITGGNIDFLIGRTLGLDVEVVAVFARPPVFRINTTARVVDGATGNLTYHGTTDVSTVPVSSHLTYHGVVCP
ncbi:MAG: hypothetical protein P8170_15790 [Gemmatimonadota bacterium]